ncbi:MAG TPA: vanadium-dependent haloperoxidase, partial [Anaeromyxobacteraceae bacterium]|nr:vanadium-dependent haloperoxidase [Anaeromyxobacteraceae bacterium]
GLYAAPLARADVLWEWNDAALAAVVGTKQLAYVQTRTMTLLDVAMYDAVNAVERRYQPHAFRAEPVPGASAEAAAAAAARAVLAALLPEQRGTWDQLYATSLARVADAQARERGASVGERAAAAVLALRANDGADAPNSYRPVTPPGRYLPTALAVGSTWMKVKPWALDSCDQFRPPAPPSLDSPIWQRDYDEIRAVGARSSAARSASQTEAARFWIMTGPAAQWPVIRALSAAPGRTLVQNARLLALASMAVADAYTAVFDAKYQYLFWRPVTAIRNGGGGREPLADEAIWEPLVDTPMHPEYPCAHCITAGAAAAVLEADFGAGGVPPIEMTSLSAPGVTHRWTTVRAWQEEVSNARVWGGIHYRNSTEVGTAVGRKIGEWVLQKQLQPLAQR